ncbi:hypothetical protein ACFSSA_02645 [Luteolibacter algae]|uniref:Calcineurin-like phosphoesterase domain-containing protein n=1 Tax=Luteolibacter algae TaxID=454151 RepID=A0ABW5D3D8_9BACT
MKLPVRIFSDLHLGHKASRISDVEMLRPLFRGAGTVVFNGDTWEEKVPPWREKSAAYLTRMRKVIEEENCEAIFLRGNHDPGFEGSPFLELAEGRIVISHGDGLLRSSSPWKHEILAGADVVEEIWSRYPRAGTDVNDRLEIAREIACKLVTRNHPEGRSLIARAMDAAFPPQRALAMLSAWATQWKYAAEFCETYFPQSEVFIMGHFHRSGIQTLGRRSIVNTGSFVVPSQAKIAEWDGELLSIHKIIEKKSAAEIATREAIWRIPPKSKN